MLGLRLAVFKGTEANCRAQCLLLLTNIESRADLEQNGYNHNQDQEASDTAANDETQRAWILLFQEDDRDLDNEMLQ